MDKLKSADTSLQQQIKNSLQYGTWKSIWRIGNVLTIKQDIDNNIMVPLH